MVANLLEACEEGQHQPFACHALHPLVERLGQIIHRLLVQRRLLARQAAVGVLLDLVRQIADDCLVGLESAQDVGLHQPAQRREAAGAVGQAPGEAGEGLGTPQQPRIHEVEEAPQVAEPILDRRAGQGQA